MSKAIQADDSIANDEPARIDTSNHYDFEVVYRTSMVNLYVLDDTCSLQFRDYSLWFDKLKIGYGRKLLAFCDGNIGGTTRTTKWGDLPHDIKVQLRRRGLVER